MMQKFDLPDKTIKYRGINFFFSVAMVLLSVYHAPPSTQATGLGYLYSGLTSTAYRCTRQVLNLHRKVTL